MNQNTFNKYFQDNTEARVSPLTPRKIADLETYNQKAKIIRQQARVAFARSAQAARQFILTR